MKLFSQYKYGIVLILILFFALTVRIARYCLDSRVEKDAVLYINMAKDWNEKGVKNAFDLNQRIPPLYIYLMMLGEKAGVGAENAGVIISIIAGSLTVISIFFLASAVMDRKLALIAAFLAAIHPIFIRLSPEVMRESLFIFCYASALAFFANGIVNKKIYLWCFGGLFASMATLTRSEGAELILIPFVWLVIEICINLIKHRKENPKKKIFTSAIFSSKTVLTQFMPGVIAAIIFFSASAFPIQAALKNTSSTWTVFDQRIVGYLKALIQ